MRPRSLHKTLHVSTCSTRLNKTLRTLRLTPARASPSATRFARGIRVKIISSAFGEELEKVWDWCDVLVLPTLSDNFGLVVAEALERGKRVITTDGAPAWDHGIHRIHGNGMGEVGNHEIHETHEKGLWSGYGGRLIYLKGYRDGTDEARVELLIKAIERICK